MKLLAILSLSAASLVTIGTSAAFADDPQLQNRLAAQRAQSPSGALQTTTVAVYSGQRFNTRSAETMREEQPETRFELRSDAHGHQFGVYVQGR